MPILVNGLRGPGLRVLDMRALLLVIACAMFAAAAPASAQDTSRLTNFPIGSLFHGTDISGARFEVVDSRFEEDATATVLFGIVGGLVNSGITGSEDAKKAEPYADAVKKLEPGRILSEKFAATLAAREFPVAAAEKGATHTLRIEIKEWGLTRTSMRDLRLTPFIRLHVVMKQGKKVVWDTYMKDSWDRSAMLPQTTNEMLVEDIENLAAKLGERIAYEIIYR